MALAHSGRRKAGQRFRNRRRGGRTWSRQLRKLGFLFVFALALPERNVGKENPSVLDSFMST